VLNKKSKRMSFVYNFNLVKDIPHFERLPNQSQAYIEMHIADVIYDSFIIPGDQDYLTARLLAQKGLLRAFYWSAAQAIEKYLKAFLLFNGGNAVDKYKRHPIRQLFNDAANINKVIKNISMEPHADINIKKDHRHLLQSITLDKFIEDIEVHGSSDNRYNSSGIEYSTHHLFALDNTVHGIRGQIGVPSIEHSFTQVHADLIASFEDNNPLFCYSTEKTHSKIPSESFPIICSSLSVTTLDFLIKNKNDTLHIKALRWLNKKMKLSQSMTKDIKNELNCL
jgi:hypothetical protein